MEYKYTKAFLLLCASSLLLAACTSIGTTLNKKQVCRETKKYTIQVKYGNEDWITYNNVISIRKPDRYRNVLTIALDDGTKIHAIGAIVRWTDKIPEYF